MKERNKHDQTDRACKARECMVSFDTFYKAYQPRLVRYLTSRASNTGFAEDVAADAMRTVYDNWDYLLTCERPDSWLFKVATHRLQRIEAQARDLCLLREDLASFEEDLRTAAVDDPWVEARMDVIVAMRSLPRRQCEVIGLHYFGDFTLAEVARILQINEGTVKTHLHRGLNNLRKHPSFRLGEKVRRRMPA